MTTNQLIKHYGTRDNALAELGIYRQKLEYWEKKGIPWGWQLKIQLATNGKLKATI